jgi:type IX secretion system PorP/SprF family membrane protein
MKGFFTLCLVALLLSVTVSRGQVPGPFYRQFYYNPYLFNPAYVAINNETEANITYRQQWTNFKDAPVTAGASLQFPTSKRVALGFNLYSDKQVLLRNSNFLATFGYVVPISKNQSLRFALSGGVGFNKLDLTAEELNTNDPAIVNAAGNNFYVDGNFGVVYSLAGLRLGFALTDIFQSNAFSEESFNKFEMSNLRNRLFSASYRFNVGVMQNFSIEPYVLYRQTEDGLQDAWEAASLIYYKNKIWTGASYHQNNGVALFFGANIKERIKFGYSYEFPPLSTGFPATSSHELHISVKLGKKKNAMAKKPAQSAPELANSANTTPPAPVTYNDPSGGNENPARILPDAAPSNKDLETPIVLSEKDRVKEQRSKKPTAVTAPPVKPQKVKKTTPIVVSEKDRVNEQRTKEPPTAVDAPPVKPQEVKKTTPKPSMASESFTMTKGHYYVVVGVFDVMSHSMKFTKEMLSKGHQVNVALNPKNKSYYVYLYSTLDPEDAKRARNEYRWKNLFKEVWVYKME